MRAILLTLILSLWFSLGVNAQEKESSGQPSKEYVETLKKMLKLSGEMDAETVKSQVCTGLRQQLSNVPDEVWNECCKDLGKNTSDELFVKLASVYQKRFTLSELEEIIVFYTSTVGKKLVESIAIEGDECSALVQQWVSQIVMELQQNLKNKGHALQ